jgi:hypothetical protein
MTFSATPPDFGSLLIQRRRWANGGLIILPKLFAYAAKAPKNLSLLKEMFMRFHYLAATTTGCVAAVMFFCYPFYDHYATPWLPLMTVPILMLYARDLKRTGYDYSDTLRICALNLMLMPVIIGGVCKQFQQIATGKKIPFGRTPKVTGRTAAPAFYCLIALLMPMLFFGIAAQNAMLERWSQAVFALINCAFMTYAVVYFIGVRACFEDIAAPLRTRAKRMSQQAEILAIPAAQKLASSLPVLTRKSA